ncbi:MAG: IPT/TIG domain-containing protein, partial [Thermoanaerobaculia bacterium]
SIAPVNGSAAGGTAVTINGTGFVTGAHVTIGGIAATNVIVVSATQITAKTPAHAAATVNVAVTNPDTSTGTLTNGFVFLAHQFDPNADGLIDIADIFYLINHFFFHGPPAHGTAGTLSGDANGDGSGDLADIFYLINFIFMHGPAPMSIPVPGRITTTAIRSSAISGEVTLGTPALRDGHYVIPVIVTTAAGSDTAQALSVSVHFSGGDQSLLNATIHRAGSATNVQPVFETSKGSSDGLSYLVSYNEFDLGRDGHPAVVAEIDIGTGTATGVRISIEPGLTMLSSQAGTSSATVANGLLRVSGTTIDRASPARPRPYRDEFQPK